MSSSPCAISGHEALPPSRTNGGNGEKLARIRLRLRGTYGAARLGADRHEIVVAASHRATVEVEAKTEFGEKQQLVTHQARRPSRSPTAPLRSRRGDLRALRTDADRAGPPAARSRSAPSTHSIAAAGSGSDSNGPRLWTSSTVAWGSCVSVRALSCASTALPAISTGRIRPPARAADIGRLKPVLRSHQPHHRAMLAVAAQRADDRRPMRIIPP